MTQEEIKKYHSDNGKKGAKVLKEKYPTPELLKEEMRRRVNIRHKKNKK